MKKYGDLLYLNIIKMMKQVTIIEATNCSSKGILQINNDKKTEYEKLIENKENFNLTKIHNIEYEQHNFIINETAIKEIENYNKEGTKKKLEGIEYLKIFLKKYAIKNNHIITSASKLNVIFTNEFDNYDNNYI